MNYIKILDQCPECHQINSSRQEVCSCGCSLVESVVDVAALEARVGELESQLQNLVKDSESFGKSAKGVESLETRVGKIESQLQKLVKDSESFAKSAKDMVSLEGRVCHFESQLDEIKEGYEDKVATLLEEKMPKTLLLSPNFFVRSLTVFGYLSVVIFMVCLVVTFLSIISAN